MKHLKLTIAALFTSLATFAVGQSAAPVASESRDASIAYIGTGNFVVGRVGRDCLAVLGRKETPQEFVSIWQQRNAKYLTATQKYMEARFREVEASSGVEKRNTITQLLNNTVRNGAETTVKSWLDRPDKTEACKRAVGLIDSGAYDFSPTSPMYAELESLVAWSVK